MKASMEKTVKAERKNDATPPIEHFHEKDKEASTMKTKIDLIEKWLDWNEWRIPAHEFCMYFEQVFRKEIRQRIKRKRQLKKDILRQMVRGP